MLIHTRFGRRSTKLPTFDQIPLNFSSGAPNFGILGQNTQRPTTTRSAGSKVKAANMADAIPIEPTGPSPRLLDRSLNNKTIKPAMTVEPDAKIGSTVPRQAIFIASYRD